MSSLCVCVCVYVRRKAPKFFEDAGIGMSPGRDFGDADFMRLNFACPRSRLEEAVRRIRAAVEAIS